MTAGCNGDDVTGSRLLQWPWLAVWSYCYRDVIGRRDWSVCLRWLSERWLTLCRCCDVSDCWWVQRCCWWLIDWLIDWLIGWLAADWLIDRQVLGQFHRLTCHCCLCLNSSSRAFSWWACTLPLLYQWYFRYWFLTLSRHCCHMGTAIKHRVRDRVRPSFVIFDIRALWRSAMSVRVPRCQKLLKTALWFSSVNGTFWFRLPCERDAFAVAVWAILLGELQRSEADVDLPLLPRYVA